MRLAIHFEPKKNKEQRLTGFDSARPFVQEVAKKSIPCINFCPFLVAFKNGFKYALNKRSNDGEKVVT